MMLIPFHSQTMANKAIIRKQWKKEQSLFLFIMVLGQKQEGYQQEQGPLAWPKDAATGTAASATLAPQEQRPHYSLEKSPVPYTVSQKSLLSHTPFVRAKIPTQLLKNICIPYIKKPLILTYKPAFQKSIVPL